jgi:hypothetical protein
MARKLDVDGSEGHGSEPKNFKRPWSLSEHDHHDVSGSPWQHPNTAMHHGLNAPALYESKLLKEQRADQGHPLTHPEAETNTRWYDKEAVQRSCPSV